MEEIETKLYELIIIQINENLIKKHKWNNDNEINSFMEKNKENIDIIIELIMSDYNIKKIIDVDKISEKIIIKYLNKNMVEIDNNYFIEGSERPPKIDCNN